ncbi:MAG: DUF481 domain-containing protein [Alcanivoracaceae bacterium]|nr:DUF481 domain-containing protein [Alcanivoracaceae bacterium]
MRLIQVAAVSVVTVASAALFAAEEGAADRKWEADLSAGMVLERGNADTNEVNGNLSAAREGDLWRNTMKLEGANKEEAVVVDPALPDKKEYLRTKERYYGLYKLDRKLGENSANYLFNVFTYEKDAFSGFQYQATYAVGLGRRWIENEKHTLDAEVGPGYRWQCLEEESGYFGCANDENQAILRAALKYKWLISESADFRQEISSDIGRDSRSTRAESILNSKINSHFSLRVRYLLEHESTAAPGAKEADHEFSVGLVYTIL